MNQLVATDSTNHGSAFYMITGTEDFEYYLDILVDNGTLDDDTKQSLIDSVDGYRLRFMMAGMKKELATENDTEAICLFSEDAGGALCAGLRYTGSSIVQWSEWYTSGSFNIALNGSNEPSGGVD